MWSVLDRNTNKHIVTLLTEFGVVECKYQKGQFTFYDKRLSMIDEETGSKKIVKIVGSNEVTYYS